jgi:hypothetical protein
MSAQTQSIIDGENRKLEALTRAGTVTYTDAQTHYRRYMANNRYLPPAEDRLDILDCVNETEGTAGEPSKMRRWAYELATRTQRTIRTIEAEITRLEGLLEFYRKRDEESE